jgi:23S rRNA-intervening sequence protein
MRDKGRAGPARRGHDPNHALASSSSSPSACCLHVSLELLVLTRNAAIKDPKLRDQAMRAAKSVCLNTAEAAGRTSPADKARVFGIARGEVLEVAAAAA